MRQRLGDTPSSARKGGGYGHGFLVHKDHAGGRVEDEPGGGAGVAGTGSGDGGQDQGGAPEREERK